MRTLTWALVAAGLFGLVPVALGQSPSPGKLSTTGIWLDGRVDDMPGLPMGPFTRVGEGSVLTVDSAQSALVSSDEGQSWKSQPILADPAKFAIRPERAILRTRSGAVILAFMNDKETTNWHWDPKTSDSPDARLPTYAVRSPDGGKTWEAPQKLHDDWTGAIRDMIQTTKGSVVFTSMMLRHQPGRHSVVTYTSPDDGRSWRRSNVIIPNRSFSGRRTSCVTLTALGCHSSSLALRLACVRRRRTDSSRSLTGRRSVAGP